MIPRFIKAIRTRNLLLKYSYLDIQADLFTMSHMGLYIYIFAQNNS